MRKNMSELSPLSELRLLIVLNGVDVTPRLNTPECETWEKKKREKHRTCSLLRTHSHLKTRKRYAIWRTNVYS